MVDPKANRFVTDELDGSDGFVNGCKLFRLSTQFKLIYQHTTIIPFLHRYPERNFEMKREPFYAENAY
jgi:hypothetical protein